MWSGFGGLQCAVEAIPSYKVFCAHLTRSTALRALQSNAYSNIYRDRQTMKIKILLFNIFVLFFISTNSVFACKCVINTQTNYFNSAEYVALIRIKAIELRQLDELLLNQQQLMEGMGSGSEYIRLSFDEKEVFKGAGSTPNYLLEWLQGGGNCAIGLNIGRSYVVFLRKELLGFVMSCTGTFEFHGEKDDSGEFVESKLLRALAKSRGEGVK
jgi:hypothetical protein